MYIIGIFFRVRGWFVLVFKKSLNHSCEIRGNWIDNRDNNVDDQMPRAGSVWVLGLLTMSYSLLDGLRECRVSWALMNEYLILHMLQPNTI